MIRQVLLPHERAAVAALLSRIGLGTPVRPTETLYEEIEGAVVGTVSRTGEVISHLAVDPDRRGEAVAAALLTAIVSRMNAEGLARRLVYTRPELVPLFESMHFAVVARSPLAAILENGVPTLADELAAIAQTFERRFGVPPAALAPGAVVLNCNPMTLGHYGLVKWAAARHRALIAFVVEEDASAFRYADRFAMVERGTADLANVLVVPSTKFVVSNLTFPSYFLKTMDERDEAAARLDAAIFRDRFRPALSICTRYVGTETDPMMIRYNAILAETLGDALVEIPRYLDGGTPISASRVRRLIQEKKIDEALALVPAVNREHLRALAEENHGRT